MGSRIKSLLFGKSTSNHFKGNSYESSIAQDPPVRGSYPVAGNGFINFEDLQRSRADKEHSRGFSASANPLRRRDHDVERPKTAPNGRGPAGGYVSANGEHERTRSGFSMKVPPNFSAYNSIPPILNISIRQGRPPPREIKVYQPKRGSSMHTRDESSSRKGFVDLLEAHSSIQYSRDVSRHYTQASGSRDYGEDVADRNINMFGERERLPIPSRDSRRLDINSPELSYLKSVYTNKKVPVEGTESRAASALGHVLGRDFGTSDDIQPRSPRQKLNSPPQTRANPSETEPISIHAKLKGDPDLSPTTNGSDGRGRAFSLMTTTSTRPSTASTRATSTPGQARRVLKEPPPVPPSSHGRNTSSSTVTPNSHFRNVSTSTVKQRPPTRSTTSTIMPAMEPKTPRSFPMSSKPNGMIVEGAKEPINLEGIVDLTNTVDTDVETKTLPAVTHENVHRDRREIVQEAITREVHYHDVYHRVLPVIDTEILPTKHYMKAADGTLVEMSASEFPAHEPTWKIEPVRPRSQTTTDPPAEHDSAEPPTVFTNRRHQKSASQPNGRTSTISTARPTVPDIPQPILTSQKTYTTKAGFPRTEYLWYHPPVFEDMHGRTQPAYIATGSPDITGLQSHVSAFTQYSDDSDGETEEELLFRDSGFGAGMLPGLGVKSPMAGFESKESESEGPLRLGKVVDDGRRSGSLDSQKGEATECLKKLRGRRKSSGVSTSSGETNGIKSMELGMNGMRIKN